MDLLLRLHLHRQIRRRTADFDLDLKHTECLDSLWDDYGCFFHLDLELLFESLDEVLLGDCGVEFAGLRDLALEDELLIGKGIYGRCCDLFLASFLFRAAADLLGVALADRRSGHKSLAMRQKIVQRVAIADDENVVLLADAGDVLEEDYFHKSTKKPR